MDLERWLDASAVATHRTRELRHLDLALKLGYFIPGRAFADGADTGLFAQLKAQWNF